MEVELAKAGFPDDRTPRRVVLSAALLALTTIAWVLWNEDLRYSLPTPRPTGLQQPPRGDVLPLPAALLALGPAASGRPLFLHFYNPECPCSRFNLEHAQTLRRRFADRVQFVDVIEAPAGSAGDLAQGTDWIADPDGQIARACGVYATPQALLLDATSRQVFRGNFNSSRFCTATATQFARRAIEQLLAGTTGPVDPRAELAYGCPLPGDAR